MKKALETIAICSSCNETELLVNIIFTDEDGNGGFDVHQVCYNCLDHIAEYSDLGLKEVKEDFIKVSFNYFNEIESLEEDTDLEQEVVSVIKKANGVRLSVNDFLVDEEMFKSVAEELLGCGSIIIDRMKKGYCQSFLNQWINY